MGVGEKGARERDSKVNVANEKLVNLGTGYTEALSTILTMIQ